MSNADLASGTNAVALRLEVHAEDQGLQILTIAAEELLIRRCDGQDVTLEALLRLGEEYWSAFASGSVK